MTDTKHSAELATCDFCRASEVPVLRKYLYRENKEREIGDGFTITRYCHECGIEGKPDTNHTDRSNLGQIEKKFDLLSTETQQTDSVETTIEEVAQTIKIIACKAGSHGRTWKEADKMIRYELSKLVQAHTSQQVDESDLAQHLKANFCDGEDDNTAVRFTYAGALEIAEYFFRLGKEQQVEEAVLQADATGAYHSGYLAGKAEVEEAVRKAKLDMLESILQSLPEEKDIRVAIACKSDAGAGDTIGHNYCRKAVVEHLENLKASIITPNHQD